jgi:hypothetical protein
MNKTEDPIRFILVHITKQTKKKRGERALNYKTNKKRGGKSSELQNKQKKGRKEL